MERRAGCTLQQTIPVRYFAECGWVRMSDGRMLNVDLVSQAISQVLDTLRSRLGSDRFDKGKFNLAAKLFRDMTVAAEIPEFLTLAAYDHID